MAPKYYNPFDAHSLLEEVASQATGRKDLTVIDTASFVAVGQTLLETYAEPTLKALSAVIAKTIFSVRPYEGKLQSLKTAQMRWGGIVRKVVNLYKGSEASTDNNTSISPNMLADGQSIDMFKINKPEVLQLNFVGQSVLQKSITRFRDQLSVALANEEEFLRFFDAVMVEFNNEIELLNEEKARTLLVNYIAGLYAMDIEVVDLVAEYNAEYGTSLTREQLLTTHLTSFMQFVASTVKIYSKRLTDMSTLYHASIDGYLPIMRHTPQTKQKMIMYDPIFIKTEASVYSSIFNPKYLEIGAFEGVNFWQSQKTPTAIQCTPSILNTTNGEQEKASAEVNLPFVLGVLFDEEAIGISPCFEYASTTPFNSAGGYYNMFVHWRFNAWTDFTENAVLFVMGDGGEVTP